MKPVQVIIDQLENRTDNPAILLAGNSDVAPKNNSTLQMSLRTVRTARNTENHPIMQRIFRLSQINISKNATLRSNPNPEPDRKSP